MSICAVCGKEYSNAREMTCSEICHEKLVQSLVARFGEFKKVVCADTGVAHRVPTRDIIEKGLSGRDLDRYPVWPDDGKCI